jgi:hypothetical protein
MDAECLKTILLDIAAHPVVMGNLIGRCGRKNVIGHTLLHAWVLCVFVCFVMACVRKCVSFCDNGLSNIATALSQKENGTSVL